MKTARPAIHASRSRAPTTRRRLSLAVFIAVMTALAGASLAWACTTVPDGGYISVAPDRGPVGTEVTITGRNWNPASEVSLRWEGTSDTFATLTPNSDGGFSTTYTITGPESEVNATYYFVATQQERMSNAPFTVTPTATSASLTVTPGRGTLPTQVTITGRNWDPASRIAIEWRGTGDVFSAPTDDAGAFSTTYTVSGPEAASTATYYFNATQGSRSATAPFTVDVAEPDPDPDPAPGPLWTLAPQLQGARSAHTATLLGGRECLTDPPPAHCGTVLVAGGNDSRQVLGSVEIYDPVGAGWFWTEDLTTARTHHSATLLPDGRVLVVGGRASDGTPLASAEIYDPRSGTWSPAGRLTIPRSDHTATLLRSGEVLVAGGAGPGEIPLATAELFNTSSRVWLPTGPLNSARDGHTATLLNDGTVLVAGGGLTARSTELFDPRTRLWTETEAMVAPRSGHSATRLDGAACEERGWCGMVLVTGGLLDYSYGPSSTELYDPVTRSWLMTEPLKSLPQDHTATLLRDGAVLVAGGDQVGDQGRVARADASVFDPVSHTWTATSPLNEARTLHSESLLNDGTVLVTGGVGDGGVTLASAELYQLVPDLVAPTIEAIDPTSGPDTGGTMVTITGSRFSAATEVRFGDASGDFVVESERLITAVAPTHAPGTVDVVVVTEEGVSATGDSARFTYTGPPGTVTDLSATAASTSEIDLTWSAVGSNGSEPPPAGRYLVKQSTSPITEASFDEATSLCGGKCTFAPDAVGASITLHVTGLARKTTYYYAVKAVGEDGRLGVMSNVASDRTFKNKHG